MILIFKCRTKKI